MRVRFYTGLPGFDVLDTTFCFVSPFVSQKSKALILFQEFVVVLVKLRLDYCMVNCYWRVLSQNKAICSLKAQVIVSSKECLLL